MQEFYNERSLEVFKIKADKEVTSKYKSVTFRDIKHMENVFLEELNKNHVRPVFTAHFTESYLVIRCIECKRF